MFNQQVAPIINTRKGCGIKRKVQQKIKPTVKPKTRVESHNRPVPPDLHFPQVQKPLV